MYVASQELCRELFELSGWIPTHWYIKSLSNGTYDGVVSLGAEKPHAAHEPLPAYSLGYLIRKLPSGKVDDHNKVTRAVQWSDKWQKWCTFRERYGVGVDRDEWKQYVYKADTPENAACKLLIELFKQNILTRED